MIIRGAAGKKVPLGGRVKKDVLLFSFKPEEVF